MTPRAVLFDVGCVLIHPQGAHFRRAARACGHDVSETVALRALASAVWAGAADPSPPLFWAGEKKARAWAAAAGLPERDGPAIWRELERADTDESPLWSVLDGEAMSTLTALRVSGLRLAAVSNGAGELERDLTRHGLRDLFDTILDSHVEGIAKPEPEIFRRAAARLDVPLDACWFVGDDPHFDVWGSRAAGVHTAVLVDRYGMRPATWETLAVGSLAEIPALLGLKGEV